MESDDSAASEVASDVDAYEDSFVDEIEEDDAPAPAKPTLATTAKPGPGPVAASFSNAKAVTKAAAPPPADESSVDPYADDDYEADEDAYSVDFEDAEDAPRAPQRSPVRRGDGSLLSRRAAIAEDAEYAYSDGSFENESRLSQSLNRLVVDLSVPVRRDSGGSSNGNNGSPQAKTHLNPNSPNVNLKVLSKPRSPVRTPSPTRLSVAPPSVSSLVLPPPAPVVPSASTSTAAHALSQAAQTLLRQESDASLSLLLRKVESKYQDELEALREQNALLAWKERELKTELRVAREELKVRKARIDKKRKRAAERRAEAEKGAARLRAEADELAARAHAAATRLEQQLMANEALRVELEQRDGEQRAVEARNLALAEKLQATLGDFHALNLKYETAVGAKLTAERRADALAAQHEMERAVLAHKAQVEAAAVEQTLARERDNWARERATLPETHRALVANERERVEKLETQLTRRAAEIEAQLARESVRCDKEVALALAAKQAAEDRAEARLQDERGKLARERDALDEQRRELVASLATRGARVDEERARLDAAREQLEVRRLRLVEERAALDATAASLEDRVRRLAQAESVLEARRAELTKLGRETLDKSRALAQRQEAYTAAQRELEALRAAHAQLQQAAQASDARAETLAREKAALEQAARQLQRERLLVAKERAQSRQFLDGAKKLGLLLHQQKALEGLMTLPPTSTG